MLERYRGEDAEDLKRSASNDFVENWTSFNALDRKIWKINPMILMMRKVVELGKVTRRL